MSRDQFRSKIAEELARMGFGPREYIWGAPSQLIVLVGGEMHSVTLKANMRKTSVERVLGRLEGMREMCG
jgi:hypothetical protein